MPLYNYDGHCQWAGNARKAKQIGEDFLRMIEVLNKFYVKPSGCRSTFWTVGDLDDEYESAPLSKYAENFTYYIEHLLRIEKDDPESMGGCCIFSGLELNPVDLESGGALHCRLHDGSPANNFLVNCFEFEVGGSTHPPEPDRVTYPFYKDALLGGVSIWPADWAYVRCSLWDAVPAEACGDPTFPYSGFHMPWMCYLSAKRAAKIRAPAGIATERTPDGGLLMIAAQTRLDPQNPEHMMRSKALAELLIEHVGAR